MNESLRLLYTPKSIFAPIPIFSIVLFLCSLNSYYEITNASMIYLTLGIMLVFLSNGASNLWNHVNDFDDDFKQGRRNALTLGIIRRKDAIIGSILLYILAGLESVFLTYHLKRPIFQLFLIWLILNWFYSDKILFGKIINYRLKTHYIGEIITYSISFPVYTIMVWLVYSDFNNKIIILSIMFLFLGLSALLIKDLKDISGDRLAGLKTLGVVFRPSVLLRYSCHLLFIYYIIIYIAIIFNVYDLYCLITLFPFIIFLRYTVIKFAKKGWIIGLQDVGAIKIMTGTMYLSIILFGIVSPL